jgi:DEAD/DEAH box helicase domain-containing protein
MCDPSKHRIVALDIETTGKSVEKDLLTVVCVWSPDVQISCFQQQDYKPIIDLLDRVDYILTFNGVHFDIPILARHCNVDPSSWIKKTVDPLFVMFNTLGFGGCRKLDYILQDNGFETKCASGAEAIVFWKEGKYEQLEHYCMEDARLTYKLCTQPSIKWGDSYVLRMYDTQNLITYV